MLKTARRRVTEAGVLGGINQFVQGSIEDLSIFPDKKFDAVLCLGGPLNHLLRAEQSEKAARELVRVARKGAPIFVSVISRIGLLKSMLTDFPHEMQYAEHHWEVADSFQACREKVSLRLTGSCRRNYANFLKNKVWKPWRWLVWKDYPHIIGKRRIDSTRIRKKWRMWIEILLKTCTHPSVVGSTEHFLLVGRKQS